MLAPRLRGALFFSVAVVVAACGSSGTEPSGNTGGNEPTNNLTSVRIASVRATMTKLGSRRAATAALILSTISSSSMRCSTPLW